MIESLCWIAWVSPESLPRTSLSVRGFQDLRALKQQVFFLTALEQLTNLHNEFYLPMPTT